MTSLAIPDREASISEESERRLALRPGWEVVGDLVGVDEVKQEAKLRVRGRLYSFPLRKLAVEARAELIGWPLGSCVAVARLHADEPWRAMRFDEADREAGMA